MIKYVCEGVRERKYRREERGERREERGERRVQGTRSHMFTLSTLSLARTCESTQRESTEYSLSHMFTGRESTLWV